MGPEGHSRNEKHEQCTQNSDVDTIMSMHVFRTVRLQVTQPWRPLRTSGRVNPTNGWHPGTTPHFLQRQPCPLHHTQRRPLPLTRRPRSQPDKRRRKHTNGRANCRGRETPAPTAAMLIKGTGHVARRKRSKMCTRRCFGAHRKGLSRTVEAAGYSLKCESNMSKDGAALPVRVGN
ncbi:hypothetical protein TCAP_06345 [Tolypocladium capitatum]|uniref:Uncharacterized protein n=1 Tax=Tolypocladium capitatum TaxID=45235 RepID=A0A2K3Q835_9HYPO|nr:hypothetical protein TCAP_06345 [Tolypocladium capitatum]